jgi:hypothetical protein
MLAFARQGPCIYAYTSGAGDYAVPAVDSHHEGAAHSPRQWPQSVVFGVDNTLSYVAASASRNRLKLICANAGL